VFYRHELGIAYPPINLLISLEKTLVATNLLKKTGWDLTKVESSEESNR
jgi:hypothetical protein